MLLPYYIPYTISDHVKAITLIQNSTGKSYSAVNVDYGDGAGEINYPRNLDIIQYVYQTTGSFNLRLSAMYSGGSDVQVATIKIYDNFDSYDTTTFFDYISATSNDYSLPNSRNKLVQSNDFATSDNINAAFLTLSENLSYLELLCHRPDLRGNETIIAWLGTEELKWIYYDYAMLGTGGSDFITTFSNQLIEIESSDLDYLSAVGFNNIVDMALRSNDNLGNNIYLIDDTSVVFLSSDLNATVLLSTHNVQFNKTFGTPASIDVDSIENVYVADTENNEVYKFRRINNQLVLQISIGGSGVASDKYRLNTPNQVRVDSLDRVIISDKENYALKIYTPLLTHVTTIDLLSSQGKALALAVDKKDDSIFVVTDQKYFTRYSKNGTVESTVVLTAINTNVLNSFIEFSGNYFYVICTGIVYKFTREGLFLKTLVVPLGNGLSANDVVTGRSDDHSQTYIASRTKVFRIDGTPPTLNIRPYTPTLYYSFDEIKVHGKEGVEDYVYNKSLFRLIHNHIVFAKNVYASFIRGVTPNNTLDRFQLGPRQFDEILRFVMSPDLYVGMNEPVLVNVVNRALGELYDFQLQALSAIAPKITLVNTTIGNLDT